MQRIGASLFGFLRGGLAGPSAGVAGVSGGSSLMERCRGLSTLSAKSPFESILTPIATPFAITMRSIIRCHFPRPRETKRIRCHGWKTRMSTANGRRIIMRRILKGRYVLTH